MKVLYISSLVSDPLFDNYINSQKTTGYTGQKYHGLFAKGFAANLRKNDVTVLSQPPIRTMSLLLKEEYVGISYRYIPIIPIPIIKQLISVFYVFFYTLYWCFKNIGEKKAVVCSLMRIYQYPPVYLGSRLFGCKQITIACDIPWMTTIQVKTTKLTPKVKFAIWISKRLCTLFDGYVLLTDTMNDVINPKKKPSIVIEGFCDIEMNNIANNIADKFDKDVVIYAGGLNYKYGIGELVNAIKMSKNENIELWLYGTGDMKQTLEQETDSRIRFWGPRSNKEVVAFELKAMILINPRPTSDEYTRYSFPSKTLEYMASGTFTMTTPLAGIPSEYFEYCGVVENYDAKGICNALEIALALGRKELHKRGLLGKEFAMKQKNNITQVGKVVTFINNMYE